MHQMMGDPGTSDAMLPHPTFEIPRRHEFQGQAPSSALEPSVFSFSNSLHRQPPPFFQPLHRPAESFRQDGCEEWSSRDSQLGAGSPTGLRDCVEDQVPGLFCPSEDRRDVMTRARVGEDDLFTFPEGEHDAVTMTARDLASLQPGKFLTDNTIDFYIRYLKEKIISPGNQNEFHFFNSFFFTKLLEKSSSAGIDECKVDYEQLRMWTADVNLFEKDYVFIPIIESSHWSLIVLCHLKSLNPSSHVERKGRPCILHLDPIEGKHEHCEGQVRSYILQAWTERTRALYNMDALHSLVQMKYVQAKVPQQDNTYDCGLYVLHYIEVFLFKWTSQDLNVLSSQGGANFTRRNFKMEVFDKRSYIQGLIFKVGGMVQVEDGNLFDTKHQDKVGLVHSPRHQHQHSPKLAKESKSKKWKEIETSILLQCMVDGGRFCNGKRGAMHWDLIAEAINLKSNGGLLRSKEQCQNRFDTLLKAYKDLNAYCEHIGKTFCEVTDDEKRSLKLATPLEKKDEGWYNSLHTIYCWRSSLSCKPGKCRILKLDDDIGNSKLTSSPLKSLRECATPFNLIESLESQKTSSRQDAFVKARNHQLPSHSQMPSTTWIPESRSHNTSTDKVTSFEPRDINSGKNCTSDNINKLHVTASVQCDGHKTKQPSSELQWMSVGFLPPLMESGMNLETNLDLQPSTSYWSDVLRGTVGNFPDNDLWLRNQLSPPNVNLTDLTCPGFEVTPAETSFPTFDDNDRNNYRWIDARTNPRMCIPTNSKAQTPPQRSPRSSCKPGASQYRGVRFRPEFQKWTAEIGVSKWKAVHKKVWLGTFDTEQAAARAFDVARKLVKCTKKYPLNLPCEKLDAYSRQIPAQLILTDMTDISMFKQVVVFIKRECQAYAARFDDMLIEQINPAFDRHDSFGDQFFKPTSSVNHATHGYENMPPSNSYDVLNVDVHSESEFLDMILDFTDLTCPGFEVTPAETSFPTFDDNDCNNYRWSDARKNPRMCIPTNSKAQTPPQRPPRSSCKPGPSQYRGVRFRPDLHKWVAEIRVAEWKAVDKKVWLGTFVTEQAAARAFDLARKLLKCTKKYPLNLPCEKLDTYSRQIPAQLILTDLTDTSMFKQVTEFIRRECRAYSASFDDTPSGQINPAFDRHDSPIFGDQFFNPTSIINQTAQWFENMFFSKSSEAHNVDDLLEWDMSLVPL